MGQPEYCLGSGLVHMADSNRILSGHRKHTRGISRRFHSGDLLQLVFVHHRASSIVRYQYFIFNYRTNCYDFSVKHLYVKRNLNCKIRDSTTPSAPRVGPNMRKSQTFKNLLLYSLIFLKN